jgi:hypothetical protein
MELPSRIILILLSIWGRTLNFIFGSRPGEWIMDRVSGFRVGH